MICCQEARGSAGEAQAREDLFKLLITLGSFCTDPVLVETVRVVFLKD